jgi:L-lactate permease
MITTNKGQGLLDYLIAFLFVFLIDGSAGFGLSTLDLSGLVGGVWTSR